MLGDAKVDEDGNVYDAKDGNLIYFDKDGEDREINVSFYLTLFSAQLLENEGYVSTLTDVCGVCVFADIICNMLFERESIWSFTKPFTSSAMVSLGFFTCLSCSSDHLLFIF